MMGKISKHISDMNTFKGNKEAVSIPVWKIVQNGLATCVLWQDHVPNPRFAFYDPDTPDNLLDDLIFDKETGLIWARDANLPGRTMTWQDAIDYCRGLTLGNRKGWRLPTVEELSSLAHSSQSNPALPSGHPFVNVQAYHYWSSTTYESRSDYAWYVGMSSGYVKYNPKSYNYHVWPVRGGK